MAHMRNSRPLMLRLLIYLRTSLVLFGDYKAGIDIFINAHIFTAVQIGLDPHQDTPVEILHVVLLGFIKYFWRDMVRNQVNDEQKVLLAQRLNSMDVRGLGISKLSGETLVNYAGSLTGRDFRVIAQVAPFVIFDMVPDDVFQAWLALSKLVPLLWQPFIEDVDEYSVSLLLNL